jgi:hypothetical protein
MPGDKFLEVTRQPDALNIEPRGKAVVTYVVTNRTGSDDHVRVKLPGADAKSKLTLALQEQSEQHISNGGTATFSVEIAAGPEAAPGSSDLKLEFIASMMEDQAFAASAVVVTIPPPKPVEVKEPGKKFPWAIVLGIAGAVLLGGGLGIGIAVSSKAKTGARCGDASDCVNGHVCLAPPGRASEDPVCLRAPSEACKQDDECSTGYCRVSATKAANGTPGEASGNTTVAAKGDPEEPATEEAKSGAAVEAGQCQSRALAGAACETQQDCVSPATCTGGKCVLALGSACDADAACESGVCGPATAAAPGGAKECLPLPSVTARCTADRRCGPGLTCTGVEGAFYCLVAVGGECFGDDLCASTFCSKNRCAASPAVGAACVESRCGWGMSCDNGVCMKPGGYACGGDAECVSRRCSHGACASVGQLMDSCTTAQQCAGLICERGQCLKPLEAACRADPECGSGVCGAGLCKRPRSRGETCNNSDLRCEGGLVCSGVCRAMKLPLLLGALQASEALQAASAVQEQRLTRVRIAPQ